MSGEVEILTAFLQNLCATIVFHIVVVLVLLCCGCSSCRRVSQDDARESVTKHVETRTDAARVVDSVFIFWRDTVLLRGDTTEIARWRTQYVTRTDARVLVDTLLRVDTLRVTERVETAAALTWWQRFRQSAFYPLVVLLIGCFTLIYAQRRSS